MCVFVKKKRNDERGSEVPRSTPRASLSRSRPDTHTHNVPRSAAKWRQRKRGGNRGSNSNYGTRGYHASNLTLGELRKAANQLFKRQQNFPKSFCIFFFEIFFIQIKIKENDIMKNYNWLDLRTHFSLKVQQFLSHKNPIFIFEKMICLKIRFELFFRVTTSLCVCVLYPASSEWTRIVRTIADCVCLELDFIYFFKFFFVN